MSREASRASPGCWLSGTRVGCGVDSVAQRAVTEPAKDVRTTSKHDTQMGDGACSKANDNAMGSSPKVFCLKKK